MATRSIVPRADGEGSLGTASKRWGSVRVVSLHVNTFVADDGGSVIKPLTTKVANYSVQKSDSLILVNALSGAITITLPTAVGCAGREYVIKKIDSSTNAVSVYTSQTIDDVSTKYLKHQWSKLHVVSNGILWHDIGKFLDSEFRVNDMTIPNGVTRSILSGEYVDLYTKATSYTVEGTLVVAGSFYFETIT